MLGKTLLVMALLTSSAFANQIFGSRGRNGQSATPGYNGRDGRALKIDITGTAQTFDLRGENGEDATGYAQNGEAAHHCQQPYETSYNLYGADGGSGGDGARGGNGGNGGMATLFIPSLSKLSLLNHITVINFGGSPGKDSASVGEGAPGCICQRSSWTIESYIWELFYKQQNGQKTSTGERRSTPNRNPPPDRGADYDWELVSTHRDSYQCSNGQLGSRGHFSGSAQQGSYGWVNILVGADSKTEVNSSLHSTVGTVMNQTYKLNGFWQERKTGLGAILSKLSKVSNEFYLGIYNQRRIKFEWLAKKTPIEAGIQNDSIVASLGGTAEKPIINASLPIKLKHKIVETPDTTIVTVTHVLNSTDPKKIAACAKNDAKGSYLCEFSDQCVYEAGYCLPK